MFFANELVLWDENGDGISGPKERAVLAKAKDINHAVLIHKGKFSFISYPRKDLFLINATLGPPELT